MRLRRTAALAVAGLVLAVSAAPAAAIFPPAAPNGAPPLDGTPGPEFPTTQNKACLGAGILPGSDLTQPPPPNLALNLREAQALSRGSGVTVAIIDTGVHPNFRLADLHPGGDYVVAGGDGLADCDAHGTLVAGIIGASSASGDGFEGVAPEARLLSIRQRSGAFNAQLPNSSDQTAQTALEVRTLARAIVHAATLGAGVIDVSLPVCVDVNRQVDQSMLSAAIAYAVDVHNALVIAAAGDTGGNTSAGCTQNPDIDPSTPSDPRNWDGVKTISTPGWFGPSVLTVGFTTATGGVTPYSLAGPWVSAAAPGTAIESLDPGGGGVVNGVGAPGQLVPVGGASFAAAYVTGVAALLRSRFPNESPANISARLLASAHSPARGIDNLVGAGVIDPVAALSYRTPPKLPDGLYRSAALVIPAAGPPPDHRPGDIAAIVIVLAVILGSAAIYGNRVIRRRR